MAARAAWPRPWHRAIREPEVHAGKGTKNLVLDILQVGGGEAGLERQELAVGGGGHQIVEIDLFVVL